MKQWLKRVTGIEAKERELEQEIALHKAAAEAEHTRIAEEELELLKKKDPKAYATKKGEPWISVLDVKVNQENIRNGFLKWIGMICSFNNLDKQDMEKKWIPKKKL